MNTPTKSPLEHALDDYAKTMIIPGMNTPTQMQGGESATPRTDAVVTTLTCQGVSADAVSASSARRLERGIATLHAQIARMKMREGELVGALKRASEALRTVASRIDREGPDLGAYAHRESTVSWSTALQSVAKEGEQT